MYPGITLQDMRPKVFAGKFEIVLYLWPTQKRRIILQNLGFKILHWFKKSAISNLLEDHALKLE